MRMHIHRSSVNAITLFFAIVGVASHALGSDSPIVRNIFAVANVVLDRHIDPPTQQEMILAGVKSVYDATDQEISRWS